MSILIGSQIVITWCITTTSCYTFLQKYAQTLPFSAYLKTKLISSLRPAPGRKPWSSCWTSKGYQKPLKFVISFDRHLVFSTRLNWVCANYQHREPTIYAGEHCSPSYRTLVIRSKGHHFSFKSPGKFMIINIFAPRGWWKVNIQTSRNHCCGFWVTWKMRQTSKAHSGTNNSDSSNFWRKIAIFQSTRNTRGKTEQTAST